MTSEDFANLSAGTQSIVTSMGVVAAGLWVYFKCIRGRIFVPRAALTLSVNHFQLSDDNRVIHVQLRVENTGNSKIKLRKAFVRLQHVAPCPASKIDSVVPTDKYMPEAQWKIIGEKAIDDAKSDIEPSEFETFEFDMVVPASVEVISVYSFVENIKNNGCGWNSTVWHYCKENRHNELTV